jgi:hypothetical protein
LKPWKDFLPAQQKRFDRTRTYVSPETGHFSSQQYLRELGQELCDRALASEKDLEGYLRLAVERPTTSIISILENNEDARRGLNLRGGVIFENHANTLTDGNEEVENSFRELEISDAQPISRSTTRPTKSDQICVYMESTGARSLCMIVEYKPAHKLTESNLRAGLLQADSGSLHLPNDVFSRIKIPTEKNAKFIYHSEWLVSAALTQTYGYMIENGLEYSYLTTGEAFVFLWIKEDDPHTLYYHLARPTLEAQADPGVILSRTAVSQVFCFCLLALQSQPRDQQWRNIAMESASTASVDYDLVLQETPVEVRTETPPTSIFNEKV